VRGLQRLEGHRLRAPPLVYYSAGPSGCQVHSLAGIVAVQAACRSARGGDRGTRGLTVDEHRQPPKAASRVAPRPMVCLGAACMKGRPGSSPLPSSPRTGPWRRHPPASKSLHREGRRSGLPANDQWRGRGCCRGAGRTSERRSEARPCPTSIGVETFGSEKIPSDEIVELIEANFDLRPGAIMDELDLRRPIYEATAAYGHFGREDIDAPSERIDKVGILRAAAGLD
jgi:hypothetical protein